MPGRRKPPRTHAINCSSPPRVKPRQAPRRPNRPSTVCGRQHACPSPSPQPPLSDMINKLQNPHPVLEPL
jgi:hypothetical protein